MSRARRFGFLALKFGLAVGWVWVSAALCLLVGCYVLSHA
jgi:hypothetical protein